MTGQLFEVLAPTAIKKGAAEVAYKRVRPRQVSGCRVERDPRIARAAPVLDAVACSLASDVFSRSVVFGCLHFLKDLPPFIDVLKRLGVTTDNAFLVPVAYSNRSYVRQALEADGWRVLAATTYGRGFANVVARALVTSLEQARRTGRRVLIVEDGGYAVPTLIARFPHMFHHVAGAVEQTANGCWRDRRAIEEFERRNGERVPFPIALVGESSIKKAVEAPLVADAIVQCIERALMQDQQGLRGRRSLVIGYGAVGSKVAEVLLCRGACVGVYDRNWERLAVARNQGYEIPRFRLRGIDDGLGAPKQYPGVLAQHVRRQLAVGKPVRLNGAWLWPRLEPDLLSFIRRFSLIVGASGSESIGPRLLTRLEDQSYVVSCSSKRSEVAVAELDAISTHVQEVPNVGTRYTLPGPRGLAKTITLLANGFPINLWGTNESIPTAHIEFVWALMLHELARIATGELRNPGLALVGSNVSERVGLLYLLNTQS